MILKQWIESQGIFFTSNDLKFLLKSRFTKLSDISRPLSKADQKFLNNAVYRYKRDEPIAYILEKEEFFGYKFKVNPAVLIPRPDTEVIVEKALEVCRKGNRLKILDLCCGSGCVGISLKKSLGEKIEVSAVDVSVKALNIARYNAKKNQVRIKFIRSNIFNNLKNRKFDLIVCNPPYVRKNLIKGSLCYEPVLALDGGKDGLKILKEVISQAPEYLEKQGFFILEFGFDQKAAVKELIEKTCCYDIIEWIRDYGRRWRGVVLCIK
jgi:release factor glutamine methyltransferase